MHTHIHTLEMIGELLETGRYFCVILIFVISIKSRKQGFRYFWYFKILVTCILRTIAIFQ